MSEEITTPPEEKPPAPTEAFSEAQKTLISQMLEKNTVDLTATLDAKHKADVEGLKNNRDKFKEEKDKHKAAAKEANDKLLMLDGDIDAIRSGAVSDVENTFAEENKTLKLQLAESQKQSDNRNIESSLDGLLADMNIVEGLRGDRKAALIANSKIEFDDNGKLESIDGKTVEEYKVAFLASDVAKYYVKADAGSGGGASGSNQTAPGQDYAKQMALASPTQAFEIALAGISKK